MGVSIFPNGPSNPLKFYESNNFNSECIYYLTKNPMSWYLKFYTILDIIPYSKSSFLLNLDILKIFLIPIYSTFPIF